jgi:hypothetical protein
MGSGGMGSGGMGGGPGSALWSKGFPAVHPAKPLVDDDGNAVLVGFLPGPQDFGLGPMGEPGKNNVYVVKVKADGSTAWVRVFPADTSYVQVFAAVGPSGQIAITGDYWTNLVFDQPLGCSNGPGMPDAFLAVLSPAGDVQYSRCFESPGVSQIFGAGIDAKGRVAIAGNFLIPDGTVAGPVTPVQEGGLALAAFGSIGQFVWSRSLTAPDGSVAGLAVAGAGDVLLLADGTQIDFGDGPKGGDVQHLFLAKYDTTGKPIWTRAIQNGPGQPPAALWGAALDAAGNAYAVGPLQGTIDPGTGPITEAQAGTFVLKYDPTGAPLWARHAAGGFFRSVAVDGAGSVLAAGELSGTMDWGAGKLISQGATDVLLARFDPAGTILWAKAYGDTQPQAAQAVGVGIDLFPRVSGTFDGVLDFGQGAIAYGKTFLARTSP